MSPSPIARPWSLRVGAAVLGLALLGTSCYGPFNLTRRVHHWNDSVTDNKWGQEGMFLLLVIVPVYGLSMLGDALIFNSIEFWGGENPISPVAMAEPLDDGRTLRVEQVAAADGPVLRLRVSQDQDQDQDQALVDEFTLGTQAGRTVLPHVSRE